MYTRNYKILNTFLQRYCHTECKIADKVEYLDTFHLIKIENTWKHHVSRTFSKAGSSDSQIKGEGGGKKKYVLAMFPYPSGKLHMGHARVYTCSDSFAKFYHMNGYKVFHPIGWDAFGLPAENAAILNKKNPRDWTTENIQVMKKQLLDLGCSFDWDHEIATCDPSYIKANQQVFLLLHKKGFAYQDMALVNWDPVDETVLANEQVDQNQCSWRSGAKVEKKHLKQWFIKTTKYGQSLYNDLKPPQEGWLNVYKMQASWIGKPTGHRIWLTAQNEEEKFHLQAWVKYPDDLRNAAFISVRSDHPLAKDTFVEKTNSDAKLLNITVFEPLSKRQVPLIVCNTLPYIGKSDTYVAFGGKEVERPIADLFDIDLPEATITDSTWSQQVVEEIKSQHCDIYPSNPNLRDWLISRQRFWGTPIPIVHCASCGAVPVRDEDLPIDLPNVSNTVTEKSTTLANYPDWVNTSCPKCNGPAKRETDTMDTFVDSSHYFLRFLDPNNKTEIVDKNIAKSNMPVDFYVGGAEHALLHLYYSRFIHKFLANEGITEGKEPFRTLLCLGTVRSKTFTGTISGKLLREDEVDLTASPLMEKATGELVKVTYEKMSKSHLNGIEPLDIINAYGIDLVRLSLLSPKRGLVNHINWDQEDLLINMKLLQKLHRIFKQYKKLKETTATTESLSPEVLKQNVQKLQETRDVNLLRIKILRDTNFLFSTISCSVSNIVISLLSSPRQMVADPLYEKSLRTILVLLFPICPHFSTEYWNFMNKYGENMGDIWYQSWPKADSEAKFNFIVRIKGLAPNSGIVISPDKIKCLTDNDAIELAKQYPNVVQYLGKGTTKEESKISSVRIIADVRDLTVQCTLGIAGKKNDDKEKLNMANISN